MRLYRQRHKRDHQHDRRGPAEQPHGDRQVRPSDDPVGLCARREQQGRDSGSGDRGRQKRTSRAHLGRVYASATTGRYASMHATSARPVVVAGRQTAGQSEANRVYSPAHIGNVPVEEWLPFTVPVIALYLYGRHRDRRRRAAVQRLPDAREVLDEKIVELVLARWAKSRHKHLSAEHLPLLYPPGPDGMTAAELAERVHADPPTVERLLAELEERGYGELEGYAGPELRVWLTVEGYDLVNVTESVLLTASAGDPNLSSTEHVSAFQAIRDM